MLTTEQLIQIRDLVWAYRRRLNHVWPTPTPLNALRFAVTEAAEAMDAFMRTMPEFNRNTAGKELSVAAELADTAMMLVTAMGEKWEPEGWRPPLNPGEGSADEAGIIDDIAARVAEALSYWLFSTDWAVYAEPAIQLIAQHPEIDDLHAAIERRLARIEARVTPAPAPARVPGVVNGF